jgi:hypothetical protein
MMLYWGFWSLVQIGSFIAILGIVLNQAYGLQNRVEPPWATALGTPVLVIAALGHFFISHFKTKQNAVNEDEEEEEEEDNDEGSMQMGCRCKCTCCTGSSP